MRPPKYHLGMSREEFLAVCTMRYAYCVVRQALRLGVIQREPCAMCGREAVAHHPDYSKPLDIQWLCQSHHMAEHRRLGWGMGGA
jgi:hypothetical protein